MGILASLLGTQNPVSQWADSNHNWLSYIGAGIGSGKTLSEGLSNAAWQGVAGQRLDQQYAKDAADKADREAKIKQSAADLAKWPDLVKYVTDTGDTAGAFSEAFKRGAPGYGDPNYGKIPSVSTDIQNFEYSQTHPGFSDYQTQKGGSSELSLTPTWGVDQDKNSKTYGQRVIGQLGKDGKFHRTDMGGAIQPIDPATMQGDKTSATVDAKTSSNARATLPSAEQAYSITQKTINALQTDPSVMAGQKENFGKLGGVIPQQMAPVIPGTNRANFKNIVDQLSGQAFLNIRQALKGAGQVTDYEGQKGEIALSRMKAAADSGDEQAFMQAVADYQDAINNGMELLRQTANGGFAAGQPAVTNGGNVTSSGVKWSVTP